MDPVSLAATALTAVTTYLLSLGGKAAEEGAKETGKAVFSWIKGKLGGAAETKAVAAFEAAPEDALNRMTLQVAPAQALQALLAKAGAASLSNVINGDNNTAAIANNNSTVHIQR